jgi:ornithine cyclodeaminase
LIQISAHQVNSALDWSSLIEAMGNAHRLGLHPQIGDLLLEQSGRSLLVRASMFDDVGIGLKAVTIFPENPGRDQPRPTVQGDFLLFDEQDGSVLASIDGAAITPWKTAADSALGSSLLSRSDAKVMTMIGAGVMARPLIEAHLSVRPSIERICLWNRTKGSAERLAGQIASSGLRIEFIDRLEEAVHGADIVSSATLSREPLIRGEWLKAGAHVDLVGAFRPDMREADDETMRRGRIFVDARATTVEHIGEISIPLAAGVISLSDIEADLFDLCSGYAVERAADGITVFKNGGGAHLDLITAKLIYEKCGP